MDKEFNHECLKRAAQELYDFLEKNNGATPESSIDIVARTEFAADKLCVLLSNLRKALQE